MSINFINSSHGNLEHNLISMNSITGIRNNQTDEAFTLYFNRPRVQLDYITHRRYNRISRIVKTISSGNDRYLHLCPSSHICIHAPRARCRCHPNRYTLGFSWHVPHVNATLRSAISLLLMCKSRLEEKERDRCVSVNEKLTVVASFVAADIAM